MLIVGFVVYGIGGRVDDGFDVRMYVRRWITSAGDRLTVATTCVSASRTGRPNRYNVGAGREAASSRPWCFKQ